MIVIAFVLALIGLAVMIFGRGILGDVGRWLPWLVVALIFGPVVVAWLLGALRQVHFDVADAVPSSVLGLLLVGYLAAGAFFLLGRSPTLTRHREQRATVRERARSRERIRMPPTGDDEVE
jgi:hypothetical protein